MMKILKSRVFVGIFAILIALIVTFGISPYINRMQTQKAEVVFVRKDVPAGTKITDNDIVVRKVSVYNLPARSLIYKKDDAINKYAKTDIYKDDYLTAAKLLDQATVDFKSFDALDGNMKAMSVSLKDFASGMSGNLKRGDIISFIGVDTQSKKAKLIPELQYVYLMAVTAENEAAIKKEENDDTAYETLTVSVSNKQAEILAELSELATLKVVLTFRGSSEMANKFLEKQSEYLAKAASADKANGGKDNG